MQKIDPHFAPSEDDAAAHTMASLMANVVAHLMERSGSCVLDQNPEMEVMRQPPIQQGWLLAAVTMRNVLLATTQGRQALRNLGFEPVFYDIEGE